MGINLTIHIVAFGLIQFSRADEYAPVDTGYPSEGWDDVWLSFWTDRGCYDRCQQEHPKSSTWPKDGENWHEGSFICHENSVYPKNWCKCWECQRDCHLREARSVDKCNIADIPAIENDVAGKVGMAIYDTVASVVSTAVGATNPLAGILIGQGMDIIKGMYEDGTDNLVQNVKDAVDERFDQMLGCLKEEISKLAAREFIDDIEIAINQLDKTAGEKDPNTKMEDIEKTWDTFNDIVNSKFNNFDSATDDEFEKLLVSSQDFVSIYALLSVEYLTLEFRQDVDRPDNEKMFQDEVKRVVADFELLKRWANTARDRIVDGMWIEMRTFPCRNHEEIVREFDEYAVEFDKHNIQPIEEIIVNFQTMKSQTDAFLADRSAVCSGSQLVKVTSLDHHYGDRVKGIYFYFDVDEMKAALKMSSSDWIGKTFDMYNARSKMFAEVIIWADHGRLAEGQSTSDFRVGDQLAFNVEDDEYCHDLDYEFCLPIASQILDPVWLCSN